MRYSNSARVSILKTRIALMRSRQKENQNIIKKCQRQINSLSISK